MSPKVLILGSRAIPSGRHPCRHVFFIQKNIGQILSLKKSCLTLWNSIHIHGYGILVIPTTILNLECSCTVCDDWVALRSCRTNSDWIFMFYVCVCVGTFYVLSWTQLNLSGLTADYVNVINPWYSNRFMFYVSLDLALDFTQSYPIHM